MNQMTWTGLTGFSGLTDGLGFTTCAIQLNGMMLDEDRTLLNGRTNPILKIQLILSKNRNQSLPVLFAQRCSLKLDS